MCAIVGALLRNIDSSAKALEAENILSYILLESRARGRDGIGWDSTGEHESGGYSFDSFRKPGAYIPANPADLGVSKMYRHGALTSFSFVANVRAEPTTEFVKDKKGSDQQPYFLRGWSMVHNGTIANDRNIRLHDYPSTIDSAAIVELLADNLNTSRFVAFNESIRKLIGSYAILATSTDTPGSMFVAANYRPIWYAETELGVFFASSREYFPGHLVPVMFEPYSIAVFGLDSRGHIHVVKNSLYPQQKSKGRALVVASGGLDSTVAAAQCIKEGYDVSLIHFTYGCRAEEHEIEAIEKIAEALGTNLTLFPINIYNPSDSRLFDKNSDIAGGEVGAEFAHEWVPARNLVMLSVATAYAEANGFEYIVLGNNLEEAGAYPDNEPEFIRKFNDLLPFAVGAGKRMKVLMPVGDLMKHEIVALGHSNGAPLHLTWSCYKNGDKHCGKCGPCFMRKTAFEINGLKEVIEYGEK